MLFYPMGTSKPCDENVVIYGFDLETMYIIKAEASKDIAGGISFNTPYNVEFITTTRGIPSIKILAATRFEDDSYDCLDDLLDYASSSLNGVINDLSTGEIVKVDSVSKIEIGNHKTSIVASIVGIPSRTFNVSISDWRWSEYWNKQKDYADSELIKVNLNKKKVYLFLEYGQSFLEDTLKCVSMVVK